MATCPKCNCGYLVEIGKKMYCMNCDYSCSKTVASLHKDTPHLHKKTSYSNEIKYTTQKQQKPIFTNMKYDPSAFPKASVDQRTRKNRKNPLSFIPAIIIIFWIIMALISFISEFFETFFF